MRFAIWKTMPGRQNIVSSLETRIEIFQIARKQGSEKSH